MNQVATGSGMFDKLGWGNGRPQLGKDVDTNETNREIFLGIINPVGIDTSGAINHLKEHLHKFGYETEVIHVTTEILDRFHKIPESEAKDEYKRISFYMDIGNDIRKDADDARILMHGVAARIREIRNEKYQGNPLVKVAYIIKSIKHPLEVAFLRKTYGVGFYLIGITSRYQRRIQYLTESKGIIREQAKELLTRDAGETDDHGQHTQEAFQSADFFVVDDDSKDNLRNCIYRIVDLIFGDPFITPTFDEYAMFMAFANSLRSADLSRQVGAVIARNEEIIASGANDCPSACGGLYWPTIDKTGICTDVESGRDYMLGYDSNKIEQTQMIERILDNLGLEKTRENCSSVKKSGLGDITEYGRVVHGEMEALLMCARNTISCKDGTLYVTTFPCHNCAKHIIAAGIKKVIYIEPYPKSKALEFYKNEITEDRNGDTSKVRFLPFVGVGPHRFIDLFALSSVFWYARKRKDADGHKTDWDRNCAGFRTPAPAFGYTEGEENSATNFQKELDAYPKRSNGKTVE